VGLILPGEGKIEEIWVDLSLEPVSFFKIRLEICQATEGPHTATFRMPGGILRSHALWKKSGLPLRKNWRKWAVFDLDFDARFLYYPSVGFSRQKVKLRAGSLA
jgi:hypothetical protein